MKEISRINNFDLIRLLAALQVVYRHSVEHFELDGWIKSIGVNFLNYFPGVPIFFTISGFLIFWSYDRNSSSLSKYFQNRVLRLYPALWFCLLITIILLLIDFPEETFKLLFSSGFWAWVLAQLTLFQFWTPDILRYWGVGTPNGSLWTIIVEIQFYVLVPFIYKAIRFNKALGLYIIFILSLTVNVYLGTFHSESIIYKLGAVSIFPYLYNFILGILAYWFWESLKKLVEGKFLLWLIVYIVYIVVFGNILGYDLNKYYIYNPLHLVSNILLAFLVLSAAFTAKGISNRCLNHNDISYGVYIYHMLVINFMVQRHYIGNNLYLLIAFGITVLLALFSWNLIEKPALQLKKNRK